MEAIACSVVVLNSCYIAHPLWYIHMVIFYLFIYFLILVITAILGQNNIIRGKAYLLYWFQRQHEIKRGCSYDHGLQTLDKLISSSHSCNMNELADHRTHSLNQLGKDRLVGVKGLQMLGQTLCLSREQYMLQWALWKTAKSGRKYSMLYMQRYTVQYKIDIQTRKEEHRRAMLYN